MLYPQLTGFAYTLQSAYIDLAGSRVLGIQSIKWQETMEGAEDVYGASPLVLQQTQGVYKATCEFEILWSEYVAFIRRIGNGFMQRRFNIGAQVQDTGAGLSSLFIPNCRIVDKGGSLEQSKASVKAVKCSVMGLINHDGFTALVQASPGTNFVGGSAGVVAGVTATLGISI